MLEFPSESLSFVHRGSESLIFYLVVPNTSPVQIEQFQSKVSLTFDVLQKLSKAKSCADIGLLDTNVFQRCLIFYSSVAEFLLRQGPMLYILFC